MNQFESVNIFRRNDADGNRTLDHSLNCYHTTLGDYLIYIYIFVEAGKLIILVDLLV